MTSYFLSLRNLCRSLGLKFEANHFLGTGKISDNDPYLIFTSVAPRYVFYQNGQVGPLRQKVSKICTKNTMLFVNWFVKNKTFFCNFTNFSVSLS